MAPTLVTYNTVINACAKAGMWAEARRLADSMAAAGIAQDTFTLSALVRTLSDLSLHQPSVLHRWAHMLQSVRTGCVHQYPVVARMSVQAVQGKESQPITLRCLHILMWQYCA